MSESLWRAAMLEVNLDIEELVLYGFRPEHRHDIADAVSRELTRLLEGDGGLRAWFAERSAGKATGGEGASSTYALRAPDFDAGSFSVPGTADPAAIGEQVAVAIYNSFRAASAPITSSSPMPSTPVNKSAVPERAAK